MAYPKPFMTITELSTLGLSKSYLKQLSRVKNAPITKTPGGGKIYFRTGELDEFMNKISTMARRRLDRKDRSL